MTQRKSSSSTLISRACIALFFVFGAGFLYMSVTASQQLSDILINCVALVIMSVFIYCGIQTKKAESGISPLLVCVDDLGYITQALKEGEGSVWETLCALMEEEVVLKNNHLKKAIKEACDEYETLAEKKSQASSQDNDYTICDVEEFVNDELLDDIANTPFSDFVSSALTGLGILGTFVGLVVGLQSFQTGSAEAINDSIAPLIDGMKIAFYTSIFGVSFSILYGAFFRNSRNRAQVALQEFLSEFYKIAGSRPQNEVVSQLLSYQQAQADDLKYFVENISLKLGDAMKEALAPALSAMPEQFSQELKSTIVPSLERMEQSFGGLVDSISQSQSNGMDNLVQHFIDEMNRCMGDQMTNLGDSIQSLCKWQSDTVEALNLVINKVCASSDQLDGINDNLGKTLAIFMDYVTQMDDMQKAMTQRCEEMMKQAETTLTQFETLRLHTETSLEQGASVVATTGEICASIQTQQDLLQTMLVVQREQLQKDADNAKAQLDEIKAVCKTMLSDQKELLDTANSNFKTQTHLFADLCNGATQNVEVAANRFTQSADSLREEFNATLTGTFTQFDKQLALSVEHFSGTLTQLKEMTQELSSVVESTPQMVDATSLATQKQVQVHLEETAKAQEAFIRTIRDSIKSMETTLAQLQNEVKE